MQKLGGAGCLFEFHFDDLAGRGADVGEIVGDFGVHVPEVAWTDFMGGGLAVGRGHLQVEIGYRDDDVRAHVGMHGRSGTGSEHPVVNPGAGGFRRDGGGDVGRLRSAG